MQMHIYLNYFKTLFISLSASIVNHSIQFTDTVLNKNIKRKRTETTKIYLKYNGKYQCHNYGSNLHVYTTTSYQILASQQEPYHGKCLNIFWAKGQEMDYYQENEKTVQED